MLTLLLGRDWTANRQYILKQIAAGVCEEKRGIILLVPELISHDTERRLSEAAGNTASRFAQVLSFTSLGHRVADLVGNAAMECMDNGGRVVAMASAARQLTGRLKAYAAVETKPEFLTDLVNAVDEFKRCCISAQDLMAASKQTEGGLSQKLEELSLIMSAYDALCAQGKKDPRDQMTWVLEQLEDMDYAANHVLYVDGFPDFTRQNFAVLEHFIRNCPQVVISLNCDQVDSADPAFQKAGQTARQLLDCAVRAGVEVHTEYVEEPRDALFPVRSALFRGSVPLVGENVTVYHADSVYLECQNVAEQILHLVRGGARYRDMVLVCTDMNTYKSVLELVFDKCGIPLYLSGTEDILRSGVISTVMYALDAALGGLEQRDVLRYLRSVMSPLDQDACDEMENHAVIWGVSGKGWTTEWKQHPDGLQGKWSAWADKRLERLNASRQLAITPLVQLREGFKNAKNLQQQVLALYDFLDQVHFGEKLSGYADQLEAEGDPRQAQILNQLWEILLTALEQLHDVLGNTVWDNESFSRLLSLLLSQYHVGTIPTVLDAVTAGPVSAMRCQQEKYLFLLGANEGNLPGYGGSVGVLTDQERVTLRNIGVPLTGGSVDGLQAEFAEIYGVFCGAGEKIYASYSGDQPSFVYRRLQNMAGGESPALPCLGHVSVNRHSAGSYLARWKDPAAAAALDALDSYEDTLLRCRYTLGTVQAGHVRQLYGERLNLSASQVDTHAQCRLSYFLKYGLRAQERKEATVDPAEFGTYVHAVLEQTARDVMAAGGFHQVSLEQTMEIAMAHSQIYCQAHFSQITSQRMEYLFLRNVGELQMVVEELWQELHAADYVPHRFELDFSDDGEMPAISIDNAAMDAALRGFVDRVDIWKREGSTYFRVVDYKTGKKDFDYCDVLNGVGLQMLLYLFALEDSGNQVLGDKPVSAGVQYFPARAPYVSTDGSMTEEEAARERLKQWKRKGLLLGDEVSLAAMDPSEKMDRLSCSRKKDGTLSGDIADREQLGMLKVYVRGWLEKMVNEIAAGLVDANPYTRGTSHNACTFCPYGEICHKETVQGRRNYKTVASQQFWEEIQKEVDRRG